MGISQKFLVTLTSLINNPQFLRSLDIQILKILNEIDQIGISINNYQLSIKFLFNELLTFEGKNQVIDNKIVKNLGGLYIVGTERNDSRRIDNQLRGRCARQGDPGTSKFFLSLEDKLLRLFGGTSIQNFMKNELFDDAPLESELLTKSLNVAQNRLEEIEYESRKNLFDYDEIINKQRNIIYY